MPKTKEERDARRKQQKENAASTRQALQDAGREVDLQSSLFFAAAGTLPAALFGSATGVRQALNVPKRRQFLHDDFKISLSQLRQSIKQKILGEKPEASTSRLSVALFDMAEDAVDAGLHVKHFFHHGLDDADVHESIWEESRKPTETVWERLEGKIDQATNAIEHAFRNRTIVGAKLCRLSVDFSCLSCFALERVCSFSPFDVAWRPQSLIDSHSNLALGQLISLLQREFSADSLKGGLIANLGYLRLYARLQEVVFPPFVQQGTKPTLDEVTALNRHCRYAVAAYGRLLGSPLVGMGSSFLLRTDRSAFLLFSRLAAQNLLDENKSSEVNSQPFFMFFDHAHKEIVVAVRGTVQLADVLTDLACNAIPFGEDSTQLAHEGMLMSARAMLPAIEAELEHAVTLQPTFKIVVTGHSLGAGVAALLTMHLCKTYPDMICYGFGMPCILSEQTAVDLSKNVVSVIVGHDVVGRLSLGAVRDLRLTLTGIHDRKPNPAELWHEVRIKRKRKEGKEGPLDTKKTSLTRSCDLFLYLDTFFLLCFPSRRTRRSKCFTPTSKSVSRSPASCARHARQRPSCSRRVGSSGSTATWTACTSKRTSSSRTRSIA